MTEMIILGAGLFFTSGFILGALVGAQAALNLFKRRL